MRGLTAAVAKGWTTLASKDWTWTVVARAGSGQRASGLRIAFSGAVQPRCEHSNQTRKGLDDRRARCDGCEMETKEEGGDGDKRGLRG